MSPVPLPRLAPILAAVGLPVVGAVAFSTVVLAVTRQSGHLHLVVNLMLGLLPLGFGLLIAWLDLREQTGWAVVAGLPWLLFLPNSPYLLTDFIHLRHMPSPWAWTYLALVVWHGFAALVAGLLSLRLVHHHLESRGRPALAWGLVLGAAALSGFGVALGRFDRWHSFDLLRHPRAVLNDVVRHLPFGSSPFEISVVAGLGCFMVGAYGFFRVLTPGPDPAAAANPELDAREGKTQAQAYSGRAVSSATRRRPATRNASTSNQRSLTS